MFNSLIPPIVTSMFNTTFNMWNRYTSREKSSNHSAILLRESKFFKQLLKEISDTIHTIVNNNSCYKDLSILEDLNAVYTPVSDPEDIVLQFSKEPFFKQAIEQAAGKTFVQLSKKKGDSFWKLSKSYQLCNNDNIGMELELISSNIMKVKLSRNDSLICEYTLNASNFNNGNLIDMCSGAFETFNMISNLLGYFATTDFPDTSNITLAQKASTLTTLHNCLSDLQIFMDYIEKKIKVMMDRIFVISATQLADQSLFGHLKNEIVDNMLYKARDISSARTAEARATMNEERIQ